MIDGKKLQRILILRLGAIGDVVQTLPTVRQLQANFPNLEVSWLLEQKSRPILDYDKTINLIEFPKEELKNVNPAKALWRMLKIRKQLKSQNFDLAVDLQGLFKSGFLAKFSGAKQVIGFHPQNTREGNQIFLDSYMSAIPKQTMHCIDLYQQIVPFLGGQIQPMDDPFQFYFEDHELSSVRTLLHRFRVKRPILLNLGASKATKRWPAQYFAKLILMIREAYPKAHILMTGAGKMDEDTELEILKSLPPGTCASAVNKTSLRELALLVKNASFLISGDSLALHLGSAFKIPSVGIFGGSALPVETKPYWEPYPGLSNPLPCYPCRKRTCSHHSCMTGILPHQVFREFQTYFQK